MLEDMGIDLTGMDEHFDEYEDKMEGEASKPEAGDVNTAVLKQGVENCHGAPSPRPYNGGEPIFQQPSTSDR